MNWKNWKKPPVSIIVLVYLYILVGALAFVGHFKDSLASPPEGV